VMRLVKVVIGCENEGEAIPGDCCRPYILQFLSHSKFGQ
jgi:hypothetical protein